MMKYKRICILLGCMGLAFLSGCVSKTQFEAVNRDYQAAQLALERCEKSAQQCQKNEAELQDQIVNCHNEIGRLSQKVETLDQSNAKKEAVISLQNTFIRLFDDSNQTLQTSINEQIAAQQLETPMSSPPVRVVLVNKLFFESGRAELSTEGQSLLNKLTGQMQDERYAHILVQGHTDDRPVHSTGGQFSNWELSVARATSVVRFLQDTVGIDPERLSATGFGHYRPIASNATEEGRRQNRRIEIIIETVGE